MPNNFLPPCCVHLAGVHLVSPITMDSNSISDSLFCYHPCKLRNMPATFAHSSGVAVAVAGVRSRMSRRVAEYVWKSCVFRSTGPRSPPTDLSQSPNPTCLWILVGLGSIVFSNRGLQFSYSAGAGPQGITRITRTSAMAAKEAAARHFTALMLCPSTL